MENKEFRPWKLKDYVSVSLLYYEADTPHQFKFLLARIGLSKRQVNKSLVDTTLTGKKVLLGKLSTLFQTIWWKDEVPHCVRLQTKWRHNSCDVIESCLFCAPQGMSSFGSSPDTTTMSLTLMSVNHNVAF